MERKRLYFGLLIVYSLGFACVLYIYGWSVLPLWRFNSNAPTRHVAQTLNVVLEYDEKNESTILVHRGLDLHLEDPVFGHTGIAVGDTSDHLHQNDGKTVVAIGGGITSVRLTDVRPDNIHVKFQFFSLMFPSFCETADQGNYHYDFYLAFDTGDAVFSQQNLLKAFHDAFIEASKKPPCASLSVALHMVECRHTGHPAWAQNDAMMEAYLDGVDYFYRINDDSLLKTKGWTAAFIEKLASYRPPNVGVVGPKHAGGNEQILTYDFVHRTHVDIFGFYYPRVFTDWYADDWITKVYIPDRSTKMQHIHLAHLMNLGQRYKNDYSIYPKLQTQIASDIVTLNRFIASRQQYSAVVADGSQVIAMSLYGRDSRYLWGAIRNAQLLPVVFPGWTLRIYTPRRDDILAVPGRIIDCLQRLGAQIAFLNTTRINSIPPTLWSYLVADDLKVNYFLVRDADSRLSLRESEAVKDWIASGYGVHCIRDQLSHGTLPVVHGLWGGKPSDMQAALQTSMYSLMLQFFGTSATAKNMSAATDSVSHNTTFQFLVNDLWPRVRSISMCHDSVTCKNWTRTLSFPLGKPASPDEYLGQTFDQHHKVIDPIKNWNAANECSGRNKVSFNASTVDNQPIILVTPRSRVLLSQPITVAPVPGGDVVRNLSAPIAPAGAA